jgi:hypothetical protein
VYIKNDLKFINLTKEKKENFYCGLCNYPLITMLDFERHKVYETCQNCYLTYVEARKKEWKLGWRPEKSVIKEYIYLRKQHDKSIINNK